MESLENRDKVWKKMVKSFLKATSSALQVRFFSCWSKFIQSHLYICSVLLVKLIPNPCHISSLDLLINELSLKYESVSYTQEIFLVFLTARGVLLVFTCNMLTKFLSMWFSSSDGLHCVTYRVHVFWNLNEEEQHLRQTM